MIPELTATEREKLSRAVCPDCDCCNKWQKGPSGGLCTNWRCESCGSSFNIGPLVEAFERISIPRPDFSRAMVPDSSLVNPNYPKIDK
jgi:hypothetical protein